MERDSRGVLLNIDCGQQLVARVTTHAYAELELNVGTSVYVIFKSVALHVVAEDEG